MNKSAKDLYSTGYKQGRFDVTADRELAGIIGINCEKLMEVCVYMGLNVCPKPYQQNGCPQAKLPNYEEGAENHTDCWKAYLTGEGE